MGADLNKTLKVTIVGDSKSASKATTDFTKSADKMSANLQKVNRGVSASGIASKLTSATASITSFATGAVDDFTKVSRETLNVQKYMGGTTESASRLNFAAKESGVANDVLGKSLGKLNTHLVANDAAWKSVGINARDAHGKLLPMDDLLPELAEKFKNMPNGPEKTALAMKLFGKAGTQMLPFLNKGKEGIKELEHESDKLGYTMSTKSVQGAKDAAKAQRLLHAEMGAVKVQIGAALIPIMAAFATILSKVLMPIIQKATGFFRDHKTIVLVVVSALAALLVVTKAMSAGMAVYNAGVKLVSAATKIWGGIQAAFNLIMDANPIALVVLAIAALVAGVVLCYTKFKWFRDFVAAVWGFLKQVITTEINAIWAVVKFFVDIFIGEWTFLWNAFKTIIVKPIAWVVDHIGGFVKEIGKLPGQIGRFFVGMWDGMKNGFKAAVNFIIGIWNKVADGLSFKVPSWVPLVGGDKWGVPHIPKLARGGDISRAGRVLVGDAGPEYLDLPSGAKVTPLAQGGHGGGSPIVINLHVAGSVHSTNDLVETIYRGLLQKTNRNGGRLGLA